MKVPGRMIWGVGALIPVMLGIGCSLTDQSVFAAAAPGTYLAVAEYLDDEGWAPFITVTIDESQSIEVVQFDYVATDLSLRSRTDSGFSGDAASDFLRDLSELPISVDAEPPSEVGSELDWINRAFPRLTERMSGGDERPVV